MKKKMFIPTPKRIPFTKAGYDKLLLEKKKLEDDRPDAIEHLRKAREMGDLSENGYYHAAKQRLSFIDSRLRHLDKLVKLGRIVRSTSADMVEIGKTVTITDGTNKLTLTIVGGYESDPSAHTVSHLSPIGRALIGKRAGDTVRVEAPAGTKEYRLASVTLK